MSKMIRDFVSQAVDAALLQPDRDGDMDRMYIPIAFAERFAEIVARECVAVTVNEAEKPFNSICCTNTALWTGEQIKKHFGLQ
jgi:hypothetical protein